MVFTGSEYKKETETYGTLRVVSDELTIAYKVLRQLVYSLINGTQRPAHYELIKRVRLKNSIHYCEYYRHPR